MKTASNIILSSTWVLGLILTMGSTEPFLLQVGINLTGLAIFAVSSWGLVVNNRQN